MKIRAFQMHGLASLADPPVTLTEHVVRDSGKPYELRSGAGPRAQSVQLDALQVIELRDILIGMDLGSQ